MSRARLIPPVDPVDIKTPSERAVAASLLSTLDDGWLIFHSYPWLRKSKPTGSYYLEEKEADFVLLHPEHGLLVLEVKGGDVKYNPASREWGQGTHKCKDPFDQARESCHELVKRVKQASYPGTPREWFPCPFGYAVVLTDCEYSGPLPMHMDPQIVFTAKDLAKLGERVKDALDAFTRSHKPLSRDDFLKVQSGLLPALHIVRVISGRVAADEVLFVRLTAFQKAALAGLEGEKRVRVEGPAGSGKTLLAMEHARRFSKDGKKTLYVCFNKNLAGDLEAAGKQHGVTVRHFHGLCYDLCKKAGLPFEVPTGTEAEAFWRDTAPELLFNAIERTSTAYDALVVDEAQDFMPQWWDPLDLLVGGADGPLFIFFDRNQALYGTDGHFPKAFTYRLPANCRNTQRIARVAGRAIAADIPVWEFAPQGVDATLRRWETPAECRRMLTNELDRLITSGGLQRKQVAILGPYVKTRSSVQSAIPGHTITENLADWRADKAVLYSTIKGFKGLEAEAVIVTDLQEFKEPYFTEKDLYVACTRGRHELVVLTGSSAIEERLRAKVAVK